MTAARQPQSGRVALVTGASRNIGRAIACALARQGADVAVHAAADAKAASETARQVEAFGVRSLVTLGDLADPEAAARIVAEVSGELGGLDTLVNNAAVRPERPFAELSYEEWRRVMGVCLDAVFLLCRAALDPLSCSDRGAIINIGGLTGHTGAPHRAHVVAAKAGVAGLTRALAHELSPRGITVNCVSPGLIETVRENGKSPAHHAAAANLVGRRGRPDEVAEAVAFLAGPEGRYITGQTLHVNGGAYLG